MQLKSRVRLDPNVRLVFDEQQFQQRVRNKLRVSRFSSKLLQVPKEQNRSNCQVTRRRFMPTLERPPELSELKLHGVKRADGALKRPPLKVVKKLLFERRAISKSHCQAPNPATTVANRACIYSTMLEPKFPCWFVSDCWWPPPSRDSCNTVACHWLLNPQLRWKKSLVMSGHWNGAAVDACWLAINIFLSVVRTKNYTDHTTYDQGLM